MNPAPAIPIETTLPSTESPTPFAYRGRGKIARLPKPVRDKVCNWMLDGVSYPDIIQRLGPDGEGLNPGHLCEWRKRGFQDWLLEQAFLDRTRQRQEPAASLSADFDATQVGHAALQLGTLHIFEAFRSLAAPQPCEGGTAPAPPADSSQGNPAHDAEFLPRPIGWGEGRGEGNSLQHPALQRSTPELGEGSSVSPEPNSVPPGSDQKSKSRNQKFSALDRCLGGDSAAFVRLINALARASRETMLLQKYQDACARARAALQPMKDPKRKLTDSERRAIVLEVDDILGLNHDPADPETSPGLPNSTPALVPAPV